MFIFVLIKHNHKITLLPDKKLVPKSVSSKAINHNEVILINDKQKNLMH